MKKLILGFSLVSVLSMTSAIALAEPMYGILMVVKGAVKIQNASKQTTDAKVGGKVIEGDTVMTGPDARAKIVMADRNVINVNPDTQVVISKYENDAASGKKNVELNLLKGKVRNNVEQTYDGEKNKFLIKTPTAVAGVRGTQFLAGFDVKTKMTSIVTFKGSVSLASVGPNGKIIGTPVTVKKGEMTQSAPGVTPESPKAVPKEEMKKMDGDSTASSKTKESTSESSAGSASVEASGDGSGSTKTDGEQKREAASDGTTSSESPKEIAPVAPSMIDSSATDTATITKEIKPPVTSAPTPPPAPPKTNPTPAPALAATPPPAGVGGSTKVKIQPIPKN